MTVYRHLKFKMEPVAKRQKTPTSAWLVTTRVLDDDYKRVEMDHVTHTAFSTQEAARQYKLECMRATLYERMVDLMAEDQVTRRRAAEETAHATGQTTSSDATGETTPTSNTDGASPEHLWSEVEIRIEKELAEASYAELNSLVEEHLAPVHRCAHATHNWTITEITIQD